MAKQIRVAVVVVTIVSALLYLAFSIDETDRKLKQQEEQLTQLELQLDDLAQAYTTKDKELENGLARNYQEIIAKIDELNQKLN